MKVELPDWDNKTGEDLGERVVRIDWWDTYSLCNSLSQIIVPALKAFKDKYAERGGCPMSVINEDDDTSNDDYIEVGRQRFFDAIDKMIWSFESISDEDSKYPDGEYNVEVDMEFRRRQQEGFDLFAKHFMDLWW